MDTSHNFSHIVAAITLVVGEFGDEVAVVGTGCEVGLPFCSVAIIALSGGCDLISSCWSRSPECWAQAGSVPFKSVFPLPTPGPLPQRRGVLKQVGPMCIQRAKVLPL